MLSQSRVAFVSGALSVAVLWGLTSLAPEESHSSGPSAGPPAADDALTTPSGQHALTLAYRDPLAPRSHPSAIDSDALAAPRPPVVVLRELPRSEAPIPLRQEVAPTSPSAAAASTRGSSNETTPAGSDANAREDAIPGFHASDRSLGIGRAAHEGARSHPLEATQSPEPTPVVATPSGDEVTAAPAASRGTPDDTALAAQPPAPLTTAGVLPPEAFADETAGLGLGNPTGGGSGGLGPEFVFRPGVSLGFDNIPDEVFSHLPEPSGGVPSVAANPGKAVADGSANANPDPGSFSELPRGLASWNAPEIVADRKPVENGAEPGGEAPATAPQPLLRFAVIPEPGTAGLLATGIFGLAMLRHRGAEASASTPRRASAGSRRG